MRADAPENLTKAVRIASEQANDFLNIVDAVNFVVSTCFGRRHQK